MLDHGLGTSCQMSGVPGSLRGAGDDSGGESRAGADGSDAGEALDLVERTWRERAEVPAHDGRLDAVVK